ncbi:MAG: FliO/MopB family protein [Alphaproteobacteria bacterium]
MDDTTTITELPELIRLLLALGFVLCLMGGLAFVLKKMGLAQNPAMKTGEKRRLKILESLPLDARRRLVILQCDDTEHLVILNANGETIIKTDLVSSVDGSRQNDKKA